MLALRRVEVAPVTALILAALVAVAGACIALEGLYWMINPDERGPATLRIVAGAAVCAAALGFAAGAVFA